MQNQDVILTFLNAVTPRVGPVNAVGLIKDTHIGAVLDLLKELGVSQEKIDATIERYLKQTAQNVMNTPVPSPIQKL